MGSLVARPIPRRPFEERKGKGHQRLVGHASRAISCATWRAHSMNTCTTWLSVRRFSEIIAIGTFRIFKLTSSNLPRAFYS